MLLQINFKINTIVRTAKYIANIHKFKIKTVGSLNQSSDLSLSNNNYALKQKLKNYCSSS